MIYVDSCVPLTRAQLFIYLKNNYEIISVVLSHVKITQEYLEILFVIFHVKNMYTLVKKHIYGQVHD